MSVCALQTTEMRNQIKHGFTGGLEQSNEYVDKLSPGSTKEESNEKLREY